MPRLTNLHLHTTPKSAIFVKNKPMLAKAKVLATIATLPDNFPLDELVERLIVLEKIELGLQQVAEQKVVSNEEAKKRFEKWLK